LLLAAQFCAGSAAAAFETQPTDADAAAALYQQGNKIDALPLYERLAAQSPANALYAERLAACLVIKFENLPTGEERNATIARAKAAAERAKSLGDSSDLLQVMLDRLANPAAAQNRLTPNLQAAERAFARGDFEAALAGYQKAAALDPRSYEARLYAGDVYFRKHDLKQAGEWFQKAILVDPDRETAYRYWGDALVAAGDPGAALPKFIEAVVAEPYASKPWMGLKRWAKDNGAVIRPPHVPVPAAPAVTGGETGKPGVVINVAPNGRTNAAAAWLAYSLNRASWKTETFAKRFPGEKAYRHSLAEEVESLQVALSVLDPASAGDADLQDLVRLNKDNMLEAYVVLSAADDGIAQDYPGYRSVHRELLRAYIEQYLVHRN
jgi:tetratricopeptide (TPR) repeat protein